MGGCLAGCRSTGRTRVYLGYEPTPEANGYGVGSAARLKLCEQMPHMGLHGFFRQEETLTDLAVDETVRHELEDFDLACCRLLFEFPLRPGTERDHRPGARRATARRSRLESAAVVAIAAQDLLTLSGVHSRRIGLGTRRL